MDAKDVSNHNGGHIANNKNSGANNNSSDNEESDGLPQIEANTGSSKAPSKSKGKQKVAIFSPLAALNSDNGANVVDRLDTSFNRLLNIEPNVSSQASIHPNVPRVAKNTKLSNSTYNIFSRNSPINNSGASVSNSNTVKKLDLFTNTAPLDDVKKPSLNKKNMNFGNQLFIDTSLKNFNTSSPPRRRNPQTLRPDNSYKQQPTNILRNRLYRSPDLIMSPLSDDLETPLFSANPLSAMTPLMSSVEDSHGGNYFKVLPPSVTTGTNVNKSSSTENSTSQKPRSLSSDSDTTWQNNNNTVNSSRLFTVLESDSSPNHRVNNNRANYASDSGPLSLISSQLFSSNVEQASTIETSNTERNTDSNIRNNGSTANLSRNTSSSEFPSSSTAAGFPFAEMHAKIGDDDPFFNSSDFDQVIDLFDILKSEKKYTNKNKPKTKKKLKKKTKEYPSSKDDKISCLSGNEKKSIRKRRSTKLGKENLNYDDSSGYEGEDEDEDIIDDS